MGEQVAAGSQNISPDGLIFGGVAQLGEHLPCKQGVKGSNPSISMMAVKGKHGHYPMNRRGFIWAYSSAG